jgi:subtilisin family serine protease
MKKFWFLLIAVIAVAASVSIVPVRSTAQKKKQKIHRADLPVPNTYIVTLSDDSVGAYAVESEIVEHGKNLAHAYGGKVKKAFSSAVKGFVAEMSEQQAEAMNADPNVVSIEEDAYISIAGSQSGAQWNLDRVDQRNMPIDGTYNYAATGTGVHAYILDTGIRPTHVEFGGRASVATDFVGDGNNGIDCNGHGTHVAGIIGSSTWGVAKGVSLHGVRVMGCDGNGQVSTLLAGVNWVTANAVKPAVANISITAAGSSPSLETAIGNSIASGVTYTIAAGNSAADACGYTPARTPNAITVGGSDETDLRARYSNYGSCIDIFAPGNLIVSTWASSDTATNNLSGTSMAAPMVAGAAALYLETNPSASAATVTQAIKSSATSGVLTTNDTSSPNLLLYSLLSGAPPPTPTPTPTATPTPTPSNGRVKIKKVVHSNTSNTSTAAFPFTAMRLAAPSFTLMDNSIYEDTNVTALGAANPVIETEAPVTGYQLTGIDCTDTVNGSTTPANATLDIFNRTASIILQQGSNVLCVFTSQPLAAAPGQANISGRVTDVSGRGVRGVALTLYDAQTGETFSSLTNPFGYYTFVNRPTLHGYTLSVGDQKRWTAQTPPRTFTLNDNLTNFDFSVQRR